MRVLLVNPNYATFEPVFQTHLGLGYIGAVLREAGHEVKGIDLNIQTTEDFMKEVENSDVALFTATTITISSVLRLLQFAKEKKGSIITVLGGPHPTCVPKELLEEYKETIDFIVYGEGEKTILELIDRLEMKGRGIKFSDIKGIAYLQYSTMNDYKIIVTPPRELIEDIDSLPFPAHDIFPDLDNYTSYVAHVNKRAAGIMTSRGCPFNCVYCFKGLFGRKYRTRSPKNVVDEWEMLVKKYKVEQIAILDDAFNINIDRAKQIYWEILKRGLRVPHLFPNGVRADFIDEELLFLMKQAGCFRIAYGIETGNEKIMQNINKNLSLDKVRRAVKQTKEIGIEVTGFFMLGLPGDTEETMQNTIDFAKELDVDWAQFTTLTPFPGTRIYDTIKKEGKLTENWNEHFSGHFDHTQSFVWNNLTPELLNKMRKRAYRQFYLRPSKAFKLLKYVSWANIKHLMHYVKGG